MIKYLGWKWYDWVQVPIVFMWVVLVTMIMSPLIVTEYMIYSSKRMIRENRFYERHDFGVIEDYSNLDDLDKQAIGEMAEEHVIGRFLYKSKMVKVWSTILVFHKGELR